MTTKTRITTTTTTGLLAGALALLLGAPALADAPWTWRESVPAGALVELRNVNGAIAAAGSSGGQVEVSATRKARSGDPAEIKIEVVKHAGGVTICAVYPAPAGEPPNECRPGGGRMKIREGYEGTAAFEVKLPAGVRFDARTVNGSIKVATLAGPAELHTVNGAIQVDSAAEVRAKTVNGSVNAAMTRTDWKGELELATVNGSVKVQLPASASTEVEASTVNGSINSDFGLPVEGKWGPKRMSGKIGAGGRKLTVKSVNGSLNLLRGS